MTHEEIKKFSDWFKKLAKKFGAGEPKTNNNPNGKFIFRENIGEVALNGKGDYFGFISEDEETSGAYSDFCLVIFPSDRKRWAISLGVGSIGFKNDFELASSPGLRRLFSRLVKDGGFCKTDFTDLSSSLNKEFYRDNDLEHLKLTLKLYESVLPVVKPIDIPENYKDDQEFNKIINGFLSAYAKIREWPTNNEHRTAVSVALSHFAANYELNLDSIEALITKRKYVILQGAPGTGKTHTAKVIASKIAKKPENVFFTQFHAETTYSDFIYGIKPKLENNEVGYEGVEGVLIKAIRKALTSPQENVILIVDEINRANLSNVLGEVFYLFEPHMNESQVELALCPDLSISRLPENLYVIGTMNTADRSLAVVDFALRRRFAWVDLKPKAIEDKGDKFHKKDFDKISEIFEWYASSNELSLQPGQGYFIAENEAAMKDRIRYELMPLIKEYLNEGYLLSAKDEFNQYFRSTIGLSLFE